MKVQMSLNDELMERVDKFAAENYLNRSALTSIALAQYMNQAEAVLALKNLSLAMRKVADTGTVDPEVKKQMEDFEKLASLLTSAK